MSSVFGILCVSSVQSKFPACSEQYVQYRVEAVRQYCNYLRIGCDAALQPGIALDGPRITVRHSGLYTVLHAFHTFNCIFMLYFTI